MIDRRDFIKLSLATISTFAFTRIPGVGSSGKQENQTIATIGKFNGLTVEQTNLGQIWGVDMPRGIDVLGKEGNQKMCEVAREFVGSTDNGLYSSIVTFTLKDGLLGAVNHVELPVFAGYKNATPIRAIMWGKGKTTDLCVPTRDDIKNGNVVVIPLEKRITESGHALICPVGKPNEAVFATPNGWHTSLGKAIRSEATDSIPMQNYSSEKFFTV